MENHRGSLGRKRYSQISLKKRQTLVASVIQSGESLTKVAKKLKIKLSTAKLILKKFKKTGTLFNKRLRNTKKQGKLVIDVVKGEQILRQSSQASEIILNKQKTNVPQKVQMLENIFSINEVNMQAINWWNTYLQQQALLPWPGYYFVI